MSPRLAARPPLPIRPMPHERDGRQPAPSPARPHPPRGSAEELHALVRDLVDHGDAVAARAGRRARRTLAEMTPGAQLRPLLRLTPTTYGTEDAR